MRGYFNIIMFLNCFSTFLFVKYLSNDCPNSSNSVYLQMCLSTQDDLNIFILKVCKSAKTLKKKSNKQYIISLINWNQFSHDFNFH